MVVRKEEEKNPKFQTNERTHDSDCVTTENSFNGDSPEGWDAGMNLHGGATGSFGRGPAWSKDHQTFYGSTLVNAK